MAGLKPLHPPSAPSIYLPCKKVHLFHGFEGFQDSIFALMLFALHFALMFPENARLGTPVFVTP